jgi:hypothetical protein
MIENGLCFKCFKAPSVSERLAHVNLMFTDALFHSIPSQQFVLAENIITHL